MKAKLQKELGLEVDPDVPLVAIISRLDRQKGIDMLTQTFDRMMNLGIQFVLLGSGEAH